MRLFVCACAVLLLACEAADNQAVEAAQDQTAICNGAAEYCAIPLHQFAFVTPHNAMSNAAEDWILPNQNVGIEQQLKDGIRSMMLDVYMQDERTILCHSKCSAGSRDFVDALVSIREFLDAYPNDVFVFHIEEGTDRQNIEAAYSEAGYDGLLFEGTDPGADWPTLGEIAASGKRFIVFAPNGDEAGTYLSYWDYVWDTPYSHSSSEEFSAPCRVQRGESTNRLMLINHFWAVPLPEDTEPFNRAQVLRDRIAQCEQEFGKTANFLGMDFYDTSDAALVVEELNQASARSQ